jgi:hypothetical protein
MTERTASTVHAPELIPRAPRGAWFALLAGPAAWSLQGLFGWFFGARVCAALPLPGVRLVLGAASLIALAVAAGGALVGWRNFQQESGGTALLGADANERVEFMSLAGLLDSSAVVVGFFWAGLSAVLVNVCGYVR